MNIFLWIISGAIAGVIPSLTAKNYKRIAEDGILGVIGGFTGGILMSALFQKDVNGFYTFFIVILVALIFIKMGNFFSKEIQ